MAHCIYFFLFLCYLVCYYQIFMTDDSSCLWLLNAHNLFGVCINENSLAAFWQICNLTRVITLVTVLILAETGTLPRRVPSDFMMGVHSTHLQDEENAGCFFADVGHFELSPLIHDFVKISFLTAEITIFPKISF